MSRRMGASSNESTVEKNLVPSLFCNIGRIIPRQTVYKAAQNAFVLHFLFIFLLQPLFLIFFLTATSHRSSGVPNPISEFDASY
ncbi:hypothetical protein M5689_015787 [Euphorbia peplus]|nr:hypothetical protein M5689_015787 [Euphorbia peplus]